MAHKKGEQVVINQEINLDTPPDALIEALKKYWSILDDFYQHHKIEYGLLHTSLERTQICSLAGSSNREFEYHADKLLQAAGQPETSEAEIRAHFLRELARLCLNLNRRDLAESARAEYEAILAQTTGVLTHARLLTNYKRLFDTETLAVAISTEVEVTANIIFKNLEKLLADDNTYTSFLSDCFTRLSWAASTGNRQDRHKILSLADTLISRDFMRYANPAVSVDLIRVIIACQPDKGLPIGLSLNLQTLVKNDLYRPLAPLVPGTHEISAVISSLGQYLDSYCQDEFTIGGLRRFAQKQGSRTKITTKTLNKVNHALFRHELALTRLFHLFADMEMHDQAVSLLSSFASDHEAMVAALNSMADANAVGNAGLATFYWDKFQTKRAGGGYKTADKLEDDFYATFPFHGALSRCVHEGTLDQLTPNDNLLAAINLTRDHRQQFIQAAIILPPGSFWHQHAKGLLAEDLSRLKTPEKGAVVDLNWMNRAEEAVSTIHSILLLQGSPQSSVTLRLN